MRVELVLNLLSWLSFIATGSATGHPGMILSESELIHCIDGHDAL